MRFLTEEWFAGLAALDLAADPAGFSGRVQVIVPAAPDGEVKAVVTFVDGCPTAAVLDTDKDAEVTLTLPYREAVRVLDGESNLNAEFMTGRMKVAGPTGPLLAFLSTTRKPGLQAAIAGLAEATTER